MNIFFLFTCVFTFSSPMMAHLRLASNLLINTSSCWSIWSIGFEFFFKIIIYCINFNNYFSRINSFVCISSNSFYSLNTFFCRSITCWLMTCQKWILVSYLFKVGSYTSMSLLSITSLTSWSKSSFGWSSKWSLIGNQFWKKSTNYMYKAEFDILILF